MHAFFIMALNRSALCPNCFTPGIVLLVRTEEDDVTKDNFLLKEYL